MSRDALRALAASLGVSTGFTDGLGRAVEVSPDTLMRACSAMGAPLERPEDAAHRLRERREVGAGRKLIPPVLVAWDGRLDPIPVSPGKPVGGELTLEGGMIGRFHANDGIVRVLSYLPFGYHRLTVLSGERTESATLISAPVRSWRRARQGGSWGVGIHLAALRSARSPDFGALGELEEMARWVGAMGGDLITVLPLLPTFNSPPPEPSPYSPVSRLFWSELCLAGEEAAGTAGAVRAPGPGSGEEAGPGLKRLDITTADAALRRALAGCAAPDLERCIGPDPRADEELIRYAAFRGAQARLGRDWRRWPQAAREGRLDPSQVDADEERFHLTAQLLVRERLLRAERSLASHGVRMGLDLAVGVHPDGYDPWSRPWLFAEGISVGAPPDPGFPSGQDWGFPPVLPHASREEGHRYLAASIAHQARVAGVVRVDHIMALSRLYWIPHGMGLHEGTYVSYPAEELFAVLTLESHRNRCEVVGENLGTVPPEMDSALARHGIRGMYMAEFEAASHHPAPPQRDRVALVSSHDTATLAGWVAGADIAERVRCGLLTPDAAPAAREVRAQEVARLARAVGVPWPAERDPAGDEPATGEAVPPPVAELLDALLHWLGASESPLIIPWLEDLWLEPEQVNLPGTRSSERPNWQRPMSRTLEEIVSAPEVAERLRRLHAARRGAH